MEKRTSINITSPPPSTTTKNPHKYKSKTKIKGTLNIVKGSAKNEEQNKIESKLLHFA